MFSIYGGYGVAGLGARDQGLVGRNAGGEGSAFNP